ncbi:bladder cancer-associated protein [Solea senegalensis]|uniref:Bladder cancer-associated protein n=2 Tax=Solea senegalensis TaxID=28829 RepID=A0AAV6QPY1_SOLSE|nr:bladder cancer-associated protein [Solea senegalensis]
MSPKDDRYDLMITTSDFLHHPCSCHPHLYPESATSSSFLQLPEQHQTNSEPLPTSFQPEETMYCLQWLLPVLLIPKPLNPALWFNHSMFMGFYLLSFLLERKPCTICALVFLAALFLICYSCWGNCFLYHCQDASLPNAAHDPAIVGT